MLHTTTTTTTTTTKALSRALQLPELLFLQNAVYIYYLILNKYYAWCKDWNVKLEIQIIYVTVNTCHCCCRTLIDTHLRALVPAVNDVTMKDLRWWRG